VLCDSQTPTDSIGTSTISRSRIALASSFADEDLGGPDNADLFRIPAALAQRRIHIMPLLCH